MPVFNELKISEIIDETDAIKSLYLEIPETLTETYLYQAGQNLLIQIETKEGPKQGQYTICTGPHEGKVGFTVPNKAGNGLSKHLLAMREGDLLNVSKPLNKPIFIPDPDARFNYYLIALDDGIISMYALLKCLLEKEPLSTVFLFYGAEDIDQVIYRENLLMLNSTYKDQLKVKLYLKDPDITRFLDQTLISLMSLTPTTLMQDLEDCRLVGHREKYLIDGSENLTKSLKKALIQKGISTKVIFTPRFNTETIKNRATMSTSQQCKATITLDGEKVELEIGGDTILQTLIDAGYDPPFSCTSGVCTTCMAKLTKGTVKMDVNYGLDEDEVEEGYILTCQSHPTSEEIEVTYDL